MDTAMQALLSEQDGVLLASTFMGKPIHAMDREELKGLVCWMMKHPTAVEAWRQVIANQK